MNKNNVTREGCGVGGFGGAWLVNTVETRHALS